MTRIGSLFSGYGGLDLAVAATLGGTVAWHADNDPAASRVLEHRWPDVPNHGDVTAIDWSRVEPVDVLTGGFPCQDVSAAGRRAGLRDGTRSGLWSAMADAIDQLRPALVVAENVRGLLNAAADSPLEPCPYCVGDGPGTGLRALGAVLGDLADIGYDASWCGLPAADVGAPHGRFRIFIAAWPTAADDDDSGRPAEHLPSSAGAEHDRSWRDSAPAADAGGGELQRRGVGGVLADPQGPGEGEGPQRERGRHAAGDGSAVARDPDSIHRAGRPPAGLQRQAGPSAGPAADSAGEGWQHDPQRARTHGDAAVGSGQAMPGGLGGPAPDADSDGLPLIGQGPEPDPRHHADGRGAGVRWGDYGPAVRRWELILSRPAPAPTQTGQRGGQQLAPVFVEWLMGLPEGWVTAVPALSRNDQLRLLGNGVVPQQAEAALRWLLTAASEGAAS